MNGIAGDLAHVSVDHFRSEKKKDCLDLIKEKITHFVFDYFFYPIFDYLILAPIDLSARLLSTVFKKISDVSQSVYRLFIHQKKQVEFSEESLKFVLAEKFDAAFLMSFDEKNQIKNRVDQKAEHLTLYIDQYNRELKLISDLLLDQSKNQETNEQLLSFFEKHLVFHLNVFSFTLFKQEHIQTIKKHPFGGEIDLFFKEIERREKFLSTFRQNVESFVPKGEQKKRFLLLIDEKLKKYNDYQEALHKKKKLHEKPAPEKAESPLKEIKTSDLKPWQKKELSRPSIIPSQESDLPLNLHCHDNSCHIDSLLTCLNASNRAIEELNRVKENEPLLTSLTTLLNQPHSKENPPSVWALKEQLYFNPLYKNYRTLSKAGNQDDPTETLRMIDALTSFSRYKYVYPKASGALLSTVESNVFSVSFPDLEKKYDFLELLDKEFKNYPSSKENDTQETNRMVELPPTLIVRLERQRHDAKGKAETEVLLPQNGLLDLSSYAVPSLEGSKSYDLVSYIVHLGSDKKGHYVSYVKKRKKKAASSEDPFNYYFCNDLMPSGFSKITKKEFYDQKNAFILFFDRSD